MIRGSPYLRRTAAYLAYWRGFGCSAKSQARLSYLAQHNAPRHVTSQRNALISRTDDAGHHPPARNNSRSVLPRAVKGKALVARTSTWLRRMVGDVNLLVSRAWRDPTGTINPNLSEWDIQYSQDNGAPDVEVGCL